ncbi:MAG TPA: LemA family protein [Methylomirabilota bacterium]|nr:LemA family protein [Methylomirabilota bacterium]
MWVVLAVLVGILVWLYNSLVWLRNQVKNAWAQIDVQLKRRHDLIPNLVEAVKGYLQHEREVLQRVTEARTRAMTASGAAQAGAAEGRLSQAVAGLMAVMERYPDLKANQNVLVLQEELVSTENRIGFARQLYNDMVARYNTRQQVFPLNLVATGLGFQPAEFFQMDAAERAVPRVDLGAR